MSSTSEQSSRLRLATFRLARRLRAQKSDESVSDTQMTVLMALVRHGAMTLSALAEHDRVSAPSMNRTVNCLEEAGLATRTEDAVDRRRTNIAITDSGEQVVAATVSKRDAWLTERLRELAPDERALLDAAAELMERIAAR